MIERREGGSASSGTDCVCHSRQILHYDISPAVARAPCNDGQIPSHYRTTLLPIRSLSVRRVSISPTARAVLLEPEMQRNVFKFLLLSPVPDFSMWRPWAGSLLFRGLYPPSSARPYNLHALTIVIITKYIYIYFYTL